MKPSSKTSGSIFIYISIILLFSQACSVLTKSQIEKINKLSVSSDTLSFTPSIILSGLSDLRVSRGIYYASSLSSPELIVGELDMIVDYNLREQKLLNSIDAYVSILNSYLRALRSLSSESRWNSIGTELRGLGRNIDSLIIKYNSIGWSEQIPVGFAKTTGKISANGGEWYMRMRQARIVREYVNEGDSLVNICTTQLIEILKSGSMNELIENEISGIKLNYLSYLRHLENSGQSASIESQREYIEMLLKAEQLKKIRDRAVTGLQTLKRTHASLIPLLKNRKGDGGNLDIIFDLNSLAIEINILIKQLEKKN